MLLAVVITHTPTPHVIVRLINIALSMFPLAMAIVFSCKTDVAPLIANGKGNRLVINKVF